MADYLMRATGEPGLRAVAACTTLATATAQQRHQAFPVATAALGRAMTGAVLLGCTLKGDARLSLRIEGDGPLGIVLADTDAGLHMRGYVQQPRVDLPLNPAGKLAVGAAVGTRGTLYVIQDLGLRERYTGSVPLATGEIGDDISRYLWESEQIPSAVGLGVLVQPDGLVRAAGGYLVQSMPGSKSEDRVQVEENLRRLGAVSWAVDAGMTPEDLLTELLRGIPHQLLARQPVEFRCHCSRARARNTFIALGAADLTALLAEQGSAELRCEFCRETYRFPASEVSEMISEAQAVRSD